MALRQVDPREVPGIRGVVEADEVLVGPGVVVEEGAVIRARRVVLGDHCFVGAGTKVTASEFRLGDYSKWHERGFGHGEGTLQIGRNCWIGGGVILDPAGGLVLDDGVGVGAGSQLWTHVQFGDVVEGCRWHSRRGIYVARDAWFVGHCLVSPVRVGERSMALLGSVVTRDMEPNHVYAGVPAEDITAKVGPQFEERSVLDKVHLLNAKVAGFGMRRSELAATSPAFCVAVTDEGMREAVEAGVTCFNLVTREYTKTGSAAEVAFLKENVPLVKFTPYGESSFVDVPDALLEAVS